MEVISKTRKKYNVDKKITIKYYLREFKSDKTKFSLYINLTVNGKRAIFKSKIYFEESDKFEEEELLKNSFYAKAIEREKALITDIVRDLKPFDKADFDIKRVYEVYSHDRWDLKTAIRDLLYFELFGTKDSNKTLIRFGVNPISIVHLSNDKKVQDVAKLYKSKIWYVDGIINVLQSENYNGFMIYPPTIFDVVTGLFEKSILMEEFIIINKEEKLLLIEEINTLISKYNDDFWC